MQPIEESETKEHLQMEGLHFDVIEATLKSIQTGSITPMVKEELKLKIQASRLAAGKEELPPPVFKEPEKFELTEEEVERRRVKRERNRIAAEKCRRKKKMETDCSVQELQALQKKNVELKNHVSFMEKEKSTILQKLEAIGINLVSRDESGSIPMTPAQLPTRSASYTENIPKLGDLTTLLGYNEMPPVTSAICVQSPFSGYQQISQLPQAHAHSRRASFVSSHVTPAAPPYRRYSADPYMCFPSTSTSWSDIPQELCEGVQQQELDEDFLKGEFNSGDEEFAELCGQLENIDEIYEADEEEEALVPGENYEKIRESPSLY